MATETLEVTIEGETLDLEIGSVAAPSGGTSVHNVLTGRDAAAAHPMAAIDGLVAAIDGKEAAGTAATAVAAHAAAASTHPISGVDGLSAALALLAPLLSPALTGTPTAPTAIAGTATLQIASTEFVAAAIDALLSAAPGALDTLDELAAALGDDPNFATTITNALAGKLAKASNLADLVDAAAARGNLGAGTVGGQVFVAATAAAIRTLLELGGAALLGIATPAEQTTGTSESVASTPKSVREMTVPGQPQAGDFTFAAGMRNQNQRCNSASAIVATWPLDLSGVNAEDVFPISRQGAGTVTIDAAAGVTMIAGGTSVDGGSVTIQTRGQGALITVCSANVIMVSGDVPAAA